jgi:hypothetical protein
MCVKEGSEKCSHSIATRLVERRGLVYFELLEMNKKFSGNGTSFSMGALREEHRRRVSLQGTLKDI